MRDQDGLTSILTAARRNDKLAVRFAIQWNRKIREGREKGFTFDTNAYTIHDNFTALHYSCSGPSLNMINDLLMDPSTNPFSLDIKLKLPSYYVPKQYLTSKKLIVKYEKECLNQYYRDPANFKISLINTQNTERAEDYVQDWNKQLQEETGIGNQRKSQIIRYSNKKFLKDFKKKLIKKEKSNTRSRRVTRDVPRSLEINRSSYAHSSDVSEDVKVGTMPTSKIGSMARSRRSSGSMASRKVGLSPMMKRYSDMTVDNSKKNEKMIGFLNQTLTKACDHLEKIYKKIASLLKNGNGNSTEVFEKFRIFWIGIFKILKILKMYKNLIGISVNFGRGSSIFLKLDQTLKYLGCSLELLILDRRKKRNFNNIWRSQLNFYCQFMQKISKIPSFRKLAVKSLKVKINNIKLCFEQEKSSGPIHEYLNNKLGKNIKL